ncbi:hypothetical protein NliqN6_5597 [Naganishia liquefaciens]|uniref:cyclin-dependent kinase n=1 Tax=Naganishia liquefaciens TaxID=104408 RepID=A0A8H3TXT8_9TREE|nr:hypothetical protein NliqN6_5597 [Naganishia liquefaciens]
MSGLPPPSKPDDGDVEFIGTSTSSRKRSIPEPQETQIFIKKRAVKVKPSIRKAEISLYGEEASPNEISIKGIAAKKHEGDHVENIPSTQPAVTVVSVPEAEHEASEPDHQSSIPTRNVAPIRKPSPELEVCIPPIDPANIPRSALVPPRSAHPPLLPCRSVYEYTRLNRIEEGTYGIVSRARCNATGGIYALKKLKLEEEKAGFPITSLREVMALMTTGAHENVVGVREIVVGDSLDQIYIVMPFIEHDLKTLLDNMPNPFLQSEVKTLLSQLLSAVAHCHSNWILHRDLKTSNLLMNNRGQIKVADFGLARKFGDPLGEMTQLVVTLWYRSPELLLGAKDYSTAVDMWSVGCIFAELMQKQPLFPGRGEIDQIGLIFKLLGRPNEQVWPGYSKLPLTKSINAIGPPYSSLRKKFSYLTEAGQDLLASLLAYDPESRISAETAGRHRYFEESPLPKHPDLFSSFPSQAAGERRKTFASPAAPARAISKPTTDLNELVF